MVAVVPTAWSWNPLTDWRTVTQFAFMRHAFVAGAAIAVMCAVVGWFVVLRQQAYTTHTLAMVAFPGATAAAYFGFAPILGYVAFTVAGALGIATLAPTEETSWGHSAAVGSVQAAALALGVLFLSRYHGFLANATSFLFGTFLGITRGQTYVLVAIALLAVGAVAVLGRPLLFTSLDPRVAAASGLPVRAINVMFVLVVGLAVAEASQFTGVLLVFALIVAPASTAQQLTARPSASLSLAIILALVYTWGGLVAAYYTNRPVGFWVTAIAFVSFLAAQLFMAAEARRPRPVR
jgi:zinc/manganese transport system permease protein